MAGFWPMTQYQTSKHTYTSTSMYQSNIQTHLHHPQPHCTNQVRTYTSILLSPKHTSTEWQWRQWTFRPGGRGRVHLPPGVALVRGRGKKEERIMDVPGTHTLLLHLTTQDSDAELLRYHATPLANGQKTTRTAPLNYPKRLHQNTQSYPPNHPI